MVSDWQKLIDVQGWLTKQLDDTLRNIVKGKQNQKNES